MKKILLIIAISLCVLSSNAQPIIIKTIGVIHKELDTTSNTWTDWSKWSKSECFIKINYINNTITISNKFKDRFLFDILIKETSGIDTEDGDKWNEKIYTGLNKDLKPIIIGIKLFNSGTYHIRIVYTNFMYIYQGESLKFDYI